ncbi:hypothetical protein AND_004458 [Anopheles darlingi]|uniref:Uncharacterized protein n=1 Tax=Anopheles darlingi TaxID=43151 RepID=W5JI55_ANODA|nr:hypothetical protein AND_004458 [Anopheles darlingi]
MSDEYLSKPLSFGAPESRGIAGTQQLQPLSPYLNYDSRLLQAQPEFIFPEGASKQRGRFELAFSQIGSSAMIGACIGGMGGLYNGLNATKLANQTGKLRRTQLLNHVMKQGAATANTLGTIAVMYSAFGVLLQWARGEDDDFNTIAAGGATGPRPGTASVRQRSGDIIVMTTKSDVEEDDINPYYWIPASVIGSLMAVLTLVHAAMYLDGFINTCNQQRYELIKYMQANGSLVPIIQSRISCSSVLDFMDYLHLDVSFDRRREGRINTAAALIIGLICSWTCILLWIWTVVINAKRARASRRLRI